MRTIHSRLLAAGVAAMSLTMLFACTVTGYGVEGGGGAGYAGSYYQPYGYYEPYGYDYGGWGGSYWVGPGRWAEGGEHRDWHGEDRGERGGERSDHGGDRGGYRGGDRGGNRGGEREHAPAYRLAPGGRSAPSIPSRPREH